MHICRISIANYRNFQALELTDLPPAVVIVGENGTGKSNLLRALRLVLDPSMPDTARQLSAEDFWDGLAAPLAGDAVVVEVDLTGFDDEDGAKSILGPYAVSTGPYVARLTYSFSALDAPEGGDILPSHYRPRIYGAGNQEIVVSRDALRYVSVRVLPALRDAEGELRSARNPLRRLIDRLALSEDDLGEIAESIDGANEDLLSIASVSDLSDSISTRLDQMVGSVFPVESTLGLAPTKTDQLVRAVRIFLEGESKRAIDQSSLGTANMLYLSLLLEEIEMREEAGETVTTVLAVEEPEAHLHPQLQRVLFKQLMASTRPIIVTTHSPHLASVAPLRSLIALIRDGNKTVGAQTPPGLFDDQAQEDIERYLDVTRAEILFAKAVILVEGAAEQYLIPAAAALKGVDLDSYGVSVCAVQGIDFAPYTQLLDAMCIPHVVITDGDPKEGDISSGLERCIRLMDEVTPEIEEAVEAGEEAAIRSHLSAAGFFVGANTLEIDLVDSAADAMKNAYDSIVNSAVASTRFSKLVDEAPSDTDSIMKMMKRIERVGKGRFAQRLAAQLTDVSQVPHHLCDAVDRIIGADAG